jgi:hypothetical protein
VGGGPEAAKTRGHGAQRRAPSPRVGAVSGGSHLPIRAGWGGADQASHRLSVTTVGIAWWGGGDWLTRGGCDA